MLARRQARERRRGRVPRVNGAWWGFALAVRLRGWWRGLSRRQRWLVSGAAAGLVGVVAGVLAWVLTAGGPVPRARQYLAFTACLLTGSRGLAAPEAARVWAGMESASLATRAKVEYLPVMSGSTEAAAEPYVASLVERHCAVVIATGAAQVQAVEAQAARFPSVRFAVVGSTAGGSSRVTALPAGGAGDAAARLIKAEVRRSR